MSLDHDDRMALAKTEALAVLTDGSVLTANGLRLIARRWDVATEDLLGAIWPSWSPSDD